MEACNLKNHILFNVKRPKVKDLPSFFRTVRGQLRL